MMRPSTCICMLLAVGSGLYLYQIKHRSQLLDREIVQTLKQTDAARDRIGVLRGEWALLNEPERLAELTHQHLGLKTLSPSQFVAMAGLGSRLPPPGSLLPPSEEPVAESGASEPAPPAPPPQVASVTAKTPATPAAPIRVASRPTPRPVMPKAEDPAPALRAPVPIVTASAAALSPPRPARSVIGGNVEQGRLPAPEPKAAVLQASAYAAPAPAASALGGSYRALPPPVPFGGSAAPGGR